MGVVNIIITITVFSASGSSSGGGNSHLRLTEAGGTTRCPPMTAKERGSGEGLASLPDASLTVAPRGAPRELGPETRCRLADRT